MQPAPAAGHGTPTPDAHAAPHWEYGGAGGPEHWGELSPDFQACAMGREQSPIDLRWPLPAQTAHIEKAFRELPLRIVHNCHTIQCNCAPGIHRPQASSPGNEGTSPCKSRGEPHHNKTK